MHIKNMALRVKKKTSKIHTGNGRGAETYKKRLVFEIRVWMPAGPQSIKNRGVFDSIPPLASASWVVASSVHSNDGCGTCGAVIELLVVAE